MTNGAGKHSEQLTDPMAEYVITGEAKWKEKPLI